MWPKVFFFVIKSVLYFTPIFKGFVYSIITGKSVSHNFTYFCTTILFRTYTDYSVPSAIYTTYSPLTIRCIVLDEFLPFPLKIRFLVKVRLIVKYQILLDDYKLTTPLFYSFLTLSPTYSPIYSLKPLSTIILDFIVVLPLESFPLRICDNYFYI